MQRYFVPYHELEQELLITGADAHHIKNVMRMRIGMPLLVSNGHVVHYAVIKGFTEQGVRVKLQYVVKENRELPIKVTIAQGLPKGDKFEWIIQKTTELGVHELIPVFSQRSIVKVDTKKAGRKLERYNRIAKEASEQSHRSRIPIIQPFMTLEEFMAYGQSFTYRLVAYEASRDEDHHALYHILQKVQEGDSICVFIGPEGGIADEELEQLVKHGFRIISLGNRVLRTETAPIFVMSAIVYELELKG